MKNKYNTKHFKKYVKDNYFKFSDNYYVNIEYGCEPEYAPPMSLSDVYRSYVIEING